MTYAIAVPLALIIAGIVLVITAAGYLAHASVPFPDELEGATKLRIFYATRRVVNPLATVGVLLFFVGVIWLLVLLVIWLLSF